MSSNPVAGAPLDMVDFQEIVDAIMKRQENFPDEKLNLSIGLVLFNIGDRYAKVTCTGGEWSSIKKNIPKPTGVPLCPDGHSLTQDAGLRLGWMENTK